MFTQSQSSSHGANNKNSGLFGWMDSDSKTTPEMFRQSVSQAHVTIRMQFLRKVYGILSVQLGFTTLISAIIMATPSITHFVLRNTWFLYLNLFLTVGLMIALMAKRTEYPLNFQLLAAFTLFESISIGVTVSLYDAWIVAQAFLITTSLVVCLTVYTFQSTRDFTQYGGILFSLLWISAIGGLMQLFIGSAVLQFVLPLFGAFLFSCFIIYDTHMIMKHLNAEEYIVGVINLYMDIINLFMKILQILNANKQRGEATEEKRKEKKR